MFEDGVVRLHSVKSEQEVDVSGMIVPPRSLKKIKTIRQTPTSTVLNQTYFRPSFHREMSEIIEGGSARVVER